ncbi:peptide-binding protein, partial [Leptospira interrogans serovar Pomona]
MKRFLKIVGVSAGLFFLTAEAAYGQEDCSKLSFMDDVSRKPRTDLPFQISEMRRLRPEDICKKKEGWFPTGLPLLNSDPNVGVGYGVRVFLINNGKKTDPFFEYTPYRFRMFA